MSQNISESRPLCCQMKGKIINSIFSHKIILFDIKKIKRNELCLWVIYGQVCWAFYFLSFIKLVYI